MAEKPKAKAREKIDSLLTAAGWIVQDVKEANITAGRGVAIREFPLKAGHGSADYLLYVDGAAAGVVEAKKEGETLTGYQIQTEKYSVGLPDTLKAYRCPLPFCYQSTGVETRFTNLLEPDARSRPVFAFHKPETLADWLMEESRSPSSTLRARLRQLPALIGTDLWSAQIRAIRNLENSLTEGRPRALIQMASGGAFHRAYFRATQQAFLEAHELVFQYFGGAFRRARTDNLKSAVKKILRGSRREEMAQFVAFRSHWGFASEFCTPAEL